MKKKRISQEKSIQNNNKQKGTAVAQKSQNKTKVALSTREIKPLPSKGNITNVTRPIQEANNQSYAIHIVSKGENLFRIAKKYNIPLEELKSLNGISERNLKPGMEIKIPTKEIKLSKSDNNSPSDHSRESISSSGLKYHVVQPGETLYRISLNYNVPIEEIQQINNLEGNLITVGQRIKIPQRETQTEKPFVLERPAQDLKVKEDSLPSKFEKNIFAKNRILTPSMLSKEGELALKRKFVEISTIYADSRYKLGGAGNGYLDCSAFVKYVFEEFGIKLPRSSAQQFQVGLSVDENELIPGDLVFFRTRGKNISHVGIYIGDNRFIHISSSRKRISIDSLEDPYFKKRYAGAKRILNGEVLDYFQDYLQKNRNDLERESSTNKKS
ncbi:MAG: NlpC/P60 family protein [Caldimicrobium sp.]|nr:NlpC/P60 family protein [Caldimicrobium sp.]